MRPTRRSPALDFSVVRGLRQRRELTLAQVAERAGVTVAVLSRLERNRSVCEIETLYRLARVFGLSASDLLGLAEKCSAHAKRAVSYRSGPFAFERVAYDGIACFRGRAGKGQTLKKPEAHGDEFEICWVQSGKLRIRLPREQHTLEPGDALQFDAVLDHTYEVLRDVEVFIVHLKKPHRF